MKKGSINLFIIIFILVFTAKAFSVEQLTADTKKFDVYKTEYSALSNSNFNSKLLKTDTLVMFGGSILGAGFLYLLPESITNWDKDDSSNIFKKWKENVKAGPVQDEDDWFLNWITHPYWGAVYYTAARSAGLNIFYSFGYSVFLSTFFWEYGIEAFAEIPSKQDLIITPVVGSIFGEMFYLTKRRILKNDYKLFNSSIAGHVTVFLMDPITTISNLFIKDKSNNDQFVAYSFPTVDNNGHIGYNISVNFKF